MPRLRSLASILLAALLLGAPLAAFAQPATGLRLSLGPNASLTNRQSNAKMGASAGIAYHWQFASGAAIRPRVAAVHYRRVSQPFYGTPEGLVGLTYASGELLGVATFPEGRLAPYALFGPRVHRLFGGTSDIAGERSILNAWVGGIVTGFGLETDSSFAGVPLFAEVRADFDLTYPYGEDEMLRVVEVLVGVTL